MTSSTLNMLYWQHPTHPEFPTEGAGWAHPLYDANLALTHSLCGCQNSHAILGHIKRLNGCIMVCFQEHFGEVCRPDTEGTILVAGHNKALMDLYKESSTDSLSLTLSHTHTGQCKQWHHQP